MKIVINRCYGGFGLSEEALAKLGRKDDWDLSRDDPALVAIVEEMGFASNGPHADLKVVEIPDDVDWSIGEYDGIEWVAEKHRTWS